MHLDRIAQAVKDRVRMARHAARVSGHRRATAWP
jgi:hypothetical protein